MTKVLAAKVTPQGVLVPRPLIAAWGDVEEVQIEQHADAIVIKPKADHPPHSHAQIVSEMQAAGLTEELPWPQPPVVSSEERARLAEKLSHGRPLSETIIEDRQDHA